MTVRGVSGLYMIESMFSWSEVALALFSTGLSGLTDQHTLSPLYTYHTDSQNSVDFLRILHHYHVTDQDIIQSDYNTHIIHR